MSSRAPSTLPIEIFADEKRTTLAMQSLHDRIPNAHFDKIEVEVSLDGLGYFLRVWKGSKVMALMVENFPDLEERELALLVLFAG